MTGAVRYTGNGCTTKRAATTVESAVNRLTEFGAVLSELVFPRICPACESAGDVGPEGLCRVCSPAIGEALARRYCDRCGTSAGPYAANDGRCSLCRGRPWGVAGTARLGPYAGPLRELLLAFKYRGRDELDRFFGERLGAALRAKPWLQEVEAVVAVPTCWYGRLLGWPYIATTLATEVARATGLPSLPLLRRIRRARSQIGLSATERRENVRGAFALTRGVALNRAVVCLVDDVATTGATLAECARMLRGAGATKVYGAVICKEEAFAD